MDNWLKEIEFEANTRGVQAKWQDYYAFQESLTTLKETRIAAVYHLQNYLIQKGILNKALDIDGLEAAKARGQYARPGAVPGIDQRVRGKQIPEYDIPAAAEQRIAEHEHIAAP